MKEYKVCIETEELRRVIRVTAEEVEEAFDKAIYDFVAQYFGEWSAEIIECNENHDLIVI